MFDFLSMFDWFGNGKALFEIAFHGPFGGRCFAVSLDSGYTGAQCQAMLAREGISIYGDGIVNGRALFWVDNANAQRAYKVLTGAGVPVGFPE